MQKNYSDWIIIIFILLQLAGCRQEPPKQVTTMIKTDKPSMEMECQFIVLDRGKLDNFPVFDSLSNNQILKITDTLLKELDNYQRTMYIN
jgi:hypothetical protein